MLDASDGRSVLEVIEEYLQKVMIPAICQGQSWGPLTSQQIDNFMATLKGHVDFLKSKWQFHWLCKDIIHSPAYVYRLPEEYQ